MSYHPPQAVCTAVEDLLDVACQRYYDQQSEETLVECRMCGEWESHRTGCPVPVLEAWQRPDLLEDR